VSLLGALLGATNREPAGCVIEVGTPYEDRSMAPLYPALREVTVEIARGKAGEAKITLATRRGQDGNWDVEDSGVFVDWKPVRIQAAFGLTTREEVIRGVVREIKVQHPPNLGDSTVQVTVQDLSLVADREHRRQVWGTNSAKSSDSQILQEVLARNQLQSDSASGQGLTGIIVNQDGTDAALLRARAEANGYELLYEGDTVFFGPLDGRLSSPSTQASILVGAGSSTNCNSVDLEVDGRKPDSVVIEFARGAGQSPERITKQPSLPLLGLEPVTSDGPGDHTLVMSGEAGADRAALDTKAQAKANELSMKVKASGELNSTAYGHVLKPGYTVRLEGVGPRFTGSYLVDTVSHRFTPEGYTQRFTLLRNAYTDAGTGSALSVLAGVLGI
jgi:phage protein D